MTNLVSKIKKLFLVLFTPYPYFLCSAYDKISNFGCSGIALGLMYSQLIFWISNSFMFFIWITRNYSFFYYFHVILFFYTIYLYFLTISKIIYLLNLLNIYK